MSSQLDVTIYLIDDDEASIGNLARPLASHGYKVEVFRSGLSFLSHYNSVGRGIAMLDAELRDIGGLALQKILAEKNEAMPVIFTSAIKDIEITVRTMKAGAVDFLIKPVQPPALLAAVSRALALEEVLFGDRMSHFIAQRRVCKLTPREREVLSRVIAGNLNKEIAADLGTAEKTVKLHRSRMMKKLSIRSVPDLVRLAQHAGIEPHSCVSDYSRYNWPGADA